MSTPQNCFNASVIEGERILLGTQGQKVQSNVAGNQTTNVTIIQAQPKNPQILEFQGGNTGGGDEGKPCQQIKIGKVLEESPLERINLLEVLKLMIAFMEEEGMTGS